MSTNGENTSWNRRDFLYGLGSSIGAVALSSLLSCSADEVKKKIKGPLSPSPAMFMPPSYIMYSTIWFFEV